MYAIIQSGGKQYRVSPGQTVKLEKIALEPGQSVEFDKVLLIADGDEVAVGAPYLTQGKVVGEIVAQDRHPKVKVVKFKRRQNYLRMHGHRQAYTEVKITDITK